MRIATIIIRVLLGLLFLFGGISYFFMTPPPMPEGALKTFMEGIMASGYLMTLVKILEIVCGLAFVSGFFVPLANLVILPVSVNICMVNVLLAPEQALMGVAVLALNIFLIYAYRSHYTGVFQMK